MLLPAISNCYPASYFAAFFLGLKALKFNKNLESILRKPTSSQLLKKLEQLPMKYIGIGATLTGRPSHTTQHTGP